MRWRGLALCPAALADRLLGHRTLRGTRLAATAGRLLGRRASRGGCLAALANRLLRCLCCVAPPVVRFPDIRAGCPALPSFPRFPLGQIPSSVVRDFYCQSAARHKAFSREVQDSLVIHRTSVVYPPCTADFHRAVHNFVHSSWGLPASPAGCRAGGGDSPGGDWQRAQRPFRSTDARLDATASKGRHLMTPDPAQARAARGNAQVADRKRNRARLRGVTAAAGLASVLTAAGVAYSLPGSAHATTQVSSSASSGASGRSAASKSSGSAGSSSSSSSSGGGLKSASAPASSSGSGQVTSGGS